MILPTYGMDKTWRTIIENELESFKYKELKIYNKTVYLYGDTTGRVQYIQHYGTDLTVVNSARVSFGRESEDVTAKDEKLIKYLIKHRHTSTLEHCGVTFKFVVPLYVRSQHHRHRTWCLSGDTEITFNRPARWRKGQHCKQTGNKGAKFTMERLYALWNNPVYHKKIKNMLVRVYDEGTKKFTVSNLADVIYSGKKQTFKVTLDDGKTLRCSKDHKILTKEGWKRLEDAVGLEVASTGLASMSKESFFLTNGTEELWRSFDWVKQQREAGLSVSEIADNAGCSYHTIRKWLKRHGLQFNPLEAMQEYNKKNGVWNKGKSGYKINRKPMTEKHREAIIAARSGNRSNFWKGGVTSERAAIGRWTSEQAKGVHENYDYICQECGKRGGTLHAHHIKPVVDFPELAREFSNLITVCKPCHYKIHSGKEMSRNKRGTPLGGVYSRVISIEAMGYEDTYDLSISGHNHNFVANGIVVHNSYNEVSRRYTDENMQFYEPEVFRTQHKSNRQASNPGDLINPGLFEHLNLSDETTCSEYLRQHHLDCVNFYNNLIKAGVCREQARGVLPQNMYTEYYGTVNLSNLLKFIDLRTHAGAQWEIQRAAEACLDIAAELWPVTVRAYQDIRGAK